MSGRTFLALLFSGLFLCLSSSCATTVSTDGDGDADGDSDGDVDGDADSDADGDGDVDGDVDGDADGDVDGDVDGDADGDGPDADLCPDADGDGVCDADDECPEGDDTVDSDGDGFPDACDCDEIGCDVHATCEQTAEGPVCTCGPGWVGDGFLCEDIDPCEDGTHDCHADAICINLAIGFDCECLAGFTGDGRDCTDINECLTEPCDVNATCTNTHGGFECVCNAGYTGDGFTCAPVGSGPCIALNDGDSFNDSSSMGGPGLLLGMQFTTTGSLAVSRCEVFTGETTGTNTIAIWSHDVPGNRPGVDLGTAAWAMSSTNGWQGADFSASIPLAAGTTYWTVWGPISGAQSSVQGGGTTLAYRGSFDGGSTWNGPFSGFWKFRCYCD